MPIKKILEVCAVFTILTLISFGYDNISFMDSRLSMIENILYSSAVIFIIIVTVLKYEKRGLDSLGLYTTNMKKQLLVGIFIFFNIISPILLRLLFGGQSSNATFSGHMTPCVFLFNLVDNIIFVGISEEIVFRGYLLTRLKEISNSSIFAIILSSVVFGLCHYPANRDVGQVLLAIIIGLLFSSYKEFHKDCSLISLALAHGLYDASLLTIGYLSLT